MDNPKRIAVALVTPVLFAASCADVDSLVHDVVESTTSIWREDRSPGEKMQKDASKVWKQENCYNQALPFFRLDVNEVSPTSVRSGEKFNHRLQYSMCPSVPDGTIKRSPFNQHLS
ncbi:MAG: hypothetical protein ACXW39_11010 [Nitrospira sp.]